MKNYHKILVAVELDTKEDAPLLEHAIDIAKDHQADVYLIHVLEHLGSYGAAYGVAAGANIETILSQKAQDSLVALANKYQLKAEYCSTKKGDSAQVIITEAQALEVDLIVVGSHGRHGLALLIGSTADGVVHSAGCDVLAVRL